MKEKYSIETTVAMSAMLDGDPDVLRSLLQQVENEKIDVATAAIKYLDTWKDQDDATRYVKIVCDMIRVHSPLENRIKETLNRL